MRHQEIRGAHQNNAQEIGGNRIQSESFDANCHEHQISYERRDPVADLKPYETADHSQTGADAIAPGPSLVPQEVVQYCELDGDGCRRRIRPAGSHRHRRKRHQLDQESDGSYSKKGRDPGIHSNPSTVDADSPEVERTALAVAGVAAPPTVPSADTFGIGSARYSARVLRIALAVKAKSRPAALAIAPRSNTRTSPNRGTATSGVMAALIAPIASRTRSSVGPKPRNDIRKMPAACVAKYVSAETSR